MGASSWVYSTENQETEDYKEYFGTGHVVGYPTNSNPSDNGHYEMIGTPLTYNTTPAYYHADEWIRFNPHPSLWLHGPIRYRTMPDEERIYRTPWGNKVDICENDTWFQ